MRFLLNKALFSLCVEKLKKEKWNRVVFKLTQFLNDNVVDIEITDGEMEKANFSFWKVAKCTFIKRCFISCLKGVQQSVRKFTAD